MPILTQVICDICGTTKDETNYWYTVIGCEDRMLLQSFEGWIAAPRPEPAGRRAICCGQACAMHVISRWMDLRIFGQQAWAKSAMTADHHVHDAGEPECGDPRGSTATWCL